MCAVNEFLCIYRKLKPQCLWPFCFRNFFCVKAVAFFRQSSHNTLDTHTIDDLPLFQNAFVSFNLYLHCCYMLIRRFTHYTFQSNCNENNQTNNEKKKLVEIKLSETNATTNVNVPNGWSTIVLKIVHSKKNPKMLSMTNALKKEFLGKCFFLLPRRNQRSFPLLWSVFSLVFGCVLIFHHPFIYFHLFKIQSSGAAFLLGIVHSKRTQKM